MEKLISKWVSLILSIWLEVRDKAKPEQLEIG